MQRGLCKSSLQPFQRILSNVRRHVYPICAFSFQKETLKIRGSIEPGWSLTFVWKVKERAFNNERNGKKNKNKRRRWQNGHSCIQTSRARILLHILRFPSGFKGKDSTATWKHSKYELHDHIGSKFRSDYYR